MPLRRRVAALLSAGVAVGGALVAGRVTAFAATLEVHPGQSIQAAVNTAHPGDVIEIEPGTYHEFVLVGTDRITLNGEGATLLPPATGTPPCGEAIGICVGSQTGTVHDVHIRGLTVSGFSVGIQLLAVDGARIDHVRSHDNTGYGIFALQSTRLHFSDNTTNRNVEAGIYIGESPNANAEVYDNTSLDNQGNGIFIRDSSHGTLTENTVKGNCIGILFLNTGGGTGLSHWTASANDDDRNNNACPGNEGAPPTSGIGIAVLGGDHITLARNEVDGNNPGNNPSLASGGIVLLSTVGVFPNGVDDSNVTVSRNELDGNHPTDILWDGNGSHNVFSHNDCDTSAPSGLC